MITNIYLRCGESDINGRGQDKVPFMSRKRSTLKRQSLKRQSIRTFLLALGLSVLCSAFLLLAFYTVYHRYAGFHSLELKKGELAELAEFVERNSDTIIQGNTDGLEKLADRFVVSYDIRDRENNLVSSSEKDVGDEDHRFAFELFEEMRSYSAHTDSIVIPLSGKPDGRVRGILTLTQKEDREFQAVFLVELLIPVVVFTIFILALSKRFSNQLRKPLGELMEAADKIKTGDLDFSVKCRQDDEIGDLANAFESMRENLKNSLFREWRTEQDRRDMVAAITHDLRTPLAIIQGHAEGLQDGLKQDGEKLDSYLDMILKNSQRAKKLIEEMNELSEVDGEGFAINLAETDLIRLIREKFSELEAPCRQKGILLQTELLAEDGVSGFYSVDEFRLSQAIDNITSNSIRFTPPGGNIQLRADLQEDGISLRIADSGPGFSGKDLANAFRKFYKGDPARSSEKGHSGLGLYIASAIIGKHGGTISAGNNSSGGAYIVIFVPKRLQVQEDE